MEDCIFCKIADGTLSARIIVQNDKAIALLDAFPLSNGHALVIPKSHYSKVQDMDKMTLHAVFDLLYKIIAAVENAAGANASTIAIHNGKEAGQEIPHVHVHIIPRFPGDGAGPVHSMFKGRPRLSSSDFDLILQRIKKRML